MSAQADRNQSGCVANDVIGSLFPCALAPLYLESGVITQEIDGTLPDTWELQ